MEIFARLFSSLNDKGVRYLVAGGIAVNLYGIERATADIDIVLDLSKENLFRFIDAAKYIGLRPKAPVKLEDFTDEEKRRGWVNDKGMTVFSLFDRKNPYFLLDVFVEEPFDFAEVYKRREKIRFGNRTIPLVPIKDLIVMKEKSSRPQDRADVFYTSKRYWRAGRMKSKAAGEPLLYYKSKEDIEAYRRKPVKLRLRWLEAQMEFFHKAMPPEAKKTRDRMREGRF